MGICVKLLLLIVTVIAVFIGVSLREISRPPVLVSVESIIEEGGNWVQLRDGRILEYFTAGPQESDKVLLFFPGYITTGKYMLTKWEPIQQALAQKIRVVSVSTAGFGKSSPHPENTLKTIAEDIKELVEHLKIKRFAALGVSMGGAHAACVAHYLDEYVENVGLVSSLADGWTEILHKKGGYLFRLQLMALSSPLVNQLLVHYYLQDLLSTPEGVQQYLRVSTPLDWNEVKDSPIIPGLLDDFVRARKYYVDGLHTGVRVASDSWPFNVSSLANGKRKVYVYGGLKDGTVPVEVAQHLSQQIPGSILVLGDHGHLRIAVDVPWFAGIMDKLFE